MLRMRTSDVVNKGSMRIFLRGLATQLMNIFLKITLTELVKKLL